MTMTLCIDVMTLERHELYFLDRSRVARFSGCNIPKRGKIYRNREKYAKWP
jgi:hypothetical protein